MTSRQLVNKNILKAFSTNAGTVDLKEIEQFEIFASEWWNPFGLAKPLHSMNKLRIPFIRNGLINTGTIKSDIRKTPHPLNGINILDIGCGGGILSEPLARLGGQITGLDANSNIIEIAQQHCKQQGLHIKYEVDAIETHATNNEEKYDAVIASEVLEHVTQKEDFIEACMKCLKPSGSFFITTMNKTTLAHICGIHLAENVFKLVPKQTHHFDKFIKPHELQLILHSNNCRTELIHGMFYNIFTNTWSWCSDTSINYCLHGIKLKPV